MQLEHKHEDFPVGPEVKSPPANAGDTGDSWSRKTPDAVGQPNWNTTTTDAHAPRAGAPQQETREATTVRSSRTTTRE